MQAHELSDISQQRQATEQPWLEFLRVPALSMGLYILAAGATDQQEPHTEDEIDYVTSGRGFIQVDGEDRAVSTGSIIYVAANIEHRFHDISEELTVVVFFAPAEYTNDQRPTTTDER